MSFWKRWFNKGCIRPKEHGTPTVPDFFVEFAIADEDRFQRLKTALSAFRAAKQSDDWRNTDYWLEFFDAESRAAFWWPTPAEREDWAKRWFSTPIDQRFNDPSLMSSGWDFQSMIDAFHNGDYELLECERVSSSVGRLNFNPLNWPYGGSDCMQALIKAFGHRITSVPPA